MTQPSATAAPTAPPSADPLAKLSLALEPPPHHQPASTSASDLLVPPLVHHGDKDAEAIALGTVPGVATTTTITAGLLEGFPTVRLADVSLDGTRIYEDTTAVPPLSQRLQRLWAERGGEFSAKRLRLSRAADGPRSTHHGGGGGDDDGDEATLQLRRRRIAARHDFGWRIPPDTDRGDDGEDDEGEHGGQGEETGEPPASRGVQMGPKGEYAQSMSVSEMTTLKAKMLEELQAAHHSLYLAHALVSMVLNSRSASSAPSTAAAATARQGSHLAAARADSPSSTAVPAARHGTTTSATVAGSTAPPASTSAALLPPPPPLGSAAAIEQELGLESDAVGVSSLSYASLATTEEQRSALDDAQRQEQATREARSEDVERRRRDEAREDVAELASLGLGVGALERARARGRSDGDAGGAPRRSKPAHVAAAAESFGEAADVATASAAVERAERRRWARQRRSDARLEVEEVEERLGAGVAAYMAKRQGMRSAIDILHDGARRLGLQTSFGGDDGAAAAGEGGAAVEMVFDAGADELRWELLRGLKAKGWGITAGNPVGALRVVGGPTRVVDGERDAWIGFGMPEAAPSYRARCIAHLSDDGQLVYRAPRPHRRLRVAFVASTANLRDGEMGGGDASLATRRWTSDDCVAAQRTTDSREGPRDGAGQDAGRGGSGLAARVHSLDEELRQAQAEVRDLELYELLAREAWQLARRWSMAIRVREGEISVPIHAGIELRVELVPTENAEAEEAPTASAAHVEPTGLGDDGVDAQDVPAQLPGVVLRFLHLCLGRTYRQRAELVRGKGLGGGNHVGGATASSAASAAPSSSFWALSSLLGWVHYASFVRSVRASLDSLCEWAAAAAADADDKDDDDDVDDDDGKGQDRQESVATPSWRRSGRGGRRGAGGRAFVVDVEFDALASVARPRRWVLDEVLQQRRGGGGDYAVAPYPVDAPPQVGGSGGTLGGFGRVLVDSRPIALFTTSYPSNLVVSLLRPARTAAGAWGAEGAAPTTSAGRSTRRRNGARSADEGTNDAVEAEKEGQGEGEEEEDAYAGSWSGGTARRLQVEPEAMMELLRMEILGE